MKITSSLYCLLFSLFFTIPLSALTRDTIQVTSREVIAHEQSYGVLHYDASVDGSALKVNGQRFNQGLGTNSFSTMQLFVLRRAKLFSAEVGLDDETLPFKGQVEFFVIVDDNIAWRSGIIVSGSAPVHCSVALNSPRSVKLYVNDGGDGTAYDHADWCNPRFVVETDSDVYAKGADTVAVTVEDILTYRQDYDTLRIDKAIELSPLRIDSVQYAHGFGTHSNSSILVYVNPRGIEFRCAVGLDDNSLPFTGSAEFLVLLDKDTVWRSGVMRSGEAAKPCRICLEGSGQLELICTDAGDGNSYDHADWVNLQMISWKPDGALVDTIPLTNVPFEEVRENDKTPHQLDRSVGKTPLQIGSRKFQHGLGAHANFLLPLLLQKKCREFRAWVGPDLSGLNVGYGHGTMEFLIIGDGNILWRSGIMRTEDEPKHCIVDLSNVNYCEFIVSDAEDGFFFDHASWCDAYLYFEQGFRPTVYHHPAEREELRTPPQPRVHINGARVFGVRPNSPVIYRVAVSGDLPIQITLSGLPSGLTFDQAQNTIRGSLAIRGEYKVHVQASNAISHDERDLIFKVGDTIAYTPLMGWNSWFVTNEFVFRDSILDAMRNMVSKRLVDFGYNYVNIDAGWQRTRSSDGTIGVSDSVGDMKQIADSIHFYGMKAGLYTSPGWITCVRNPGSYGFEERDASTYAAWGYDLVKNDWCSATEVFGPNQSHEDVIRVLKKLGDAFKKQSRDIQYTVCQYGEDEVWSWARTVGAHYWRTAADNSDNWWTMSVVNGFPNYRLSSFAGPDGWNDYDFLLLGEGMGPVGRRRHTLISPIEQYTHMTLWVIGRSPLIMSFSLWDLDPFTLNILCNAEVLDVHEDPTTTAGRRVAHPEFYTEVWMNEMSDGSKAVALFNRDNYATKRITAKWSDLGIAPGKRLRVRDCWRQHDIGFFEDSVSLEVPSHGCMLLRLYNDNVVEVRAEVENTLSVTIAPQPTSHTVQLHLKSTASGSCSIQLFDMLGNAVLTSPEFDYSPGLQHHQLSLDKSLACGVYMIKLRTATETISCLVNVTE